MKPDLPPPALLKSAGNFGRPKKPLSVLINQADAPDANPKLPHLTPLTVTTPSRAIWGDRYPPTSLGSADIVANAAPLTARPPASLSPEDNDSCTVLVPGPDSGVACTVVVTPFRKVKFDESADTPPGSPSLDAHDTHDHDTHDTLPTPGIGPTIAPGFIVHPLVSTEDHDEQTSWQQRFAPLPNSSPACSSPIAEESVIESPVKECLVESSPPSTSLPSTSPLNTSPLNTSAPASPQPEVDTNSDRPGIFTPVVATFGLERLPGLHSFRLLPPCPNPAQMASSPDFSYLNMANQQQFPGESAHDNWRRIAAQRLVPKLTMLSPGAYLEPVYQQHMDRMYPPPLRALEPSPDMPRYYSSAETLLAPAGPHNYGPPGTGLLINPMQTLHTGVPVPFSPLRSFPSNHVPLVMPCPPLVPPPAPGSGGDSAMSSPDFEEHPDLITPFVDLSMCSDSGMEEDSVVECDNPVIIHHTIEPITTHQPRKANEHEQVSVVAKLEANRELMLLASSRKKGLYGCHHCKTKFTTLMEMAVHIDRYQVKRLYLCDYETCVWSVVGFPQRGECRRHTNIQHNDSTVLGCEVCGRPFARFDSYRRHMALRHNDETKPTVRRRRPKAKAALSDSEVEDDDEIDVSDSSELYRLAQDLAPSNPASQAMEIPLSSPPPIDEMEEDLSPCMKSSRRSSVESATLNPAVLSPDSGPGSPIEEHVSIRGASSPVTYL